MSVTTANLGLKLYAPTAEDSTVLEKDFKIAIAGTGDSSNFAKIDTAYSELLGKINGIPVLNKVALTKTSDNTYNAAVSGIEEYSTALFFLFFFPEQTTGVVTIAINSLSPKELKHYVNGAKSQLGSGDIKSGTGYIVHYDGTDFVLDSDDPNIYAKIALKADADEVGDIGNLTTSQKGNIVLAVNDLDANKAAKVHASQHRTTGSDPLTAEDIGAAKTIHAGEHSTTGNDPLSPADIGAATSTELETAKSTLTAHTGNSDIHVNSTEKSTWNGKANGTHASQHSASGNDPVTPEAIGAAESTHASRHETGGADPVKKISIDAYVEKVTPFTGTTIDFDTSPVLSITLTASTSFTSITATVPDNYCKTGILLLTTGSTAPTVTFPSNVKWASDEVEIKASSLHEIVFRKYPGVSQWIAACAATVSL